MNLAGIVRTKEETVDYYYKSGSLDKYQPVDSIEVTLQPGGRVYRGNTTMYVDEYTPQWSKAGPEDYYTNGANNNDGNNRNNGFYLFDSLAYGDYTLVFDAPGYWKDSVGITVSGSRFFQYENFFLVSSVPPFVRTFSPKDHESMHPAWEPVILEFSHTMDTASVEKGLELTPHNDLIMSWNIDNSELTLTAAGDTLDVETSYTLTLKADSVLGNRSQHLDGNADGVGADDFVLHFTTSPKDIYPPEVVDFYPPRSLSHDDLQPVISFFFDEKIDTSGGDIREKFALILTSGANAEIPTVFDMYISDNKTVVSLFPTEELVRGYRYARYAYEGIRDHAGNVTTGDQVGSLRIDDMIPWYADTLVIDHFGPGLTGHWKQPKFSGSTVNLLDGETSANDSIVNHASGSGHSMEIYYKFDASAGSAFLREWLDESSTQAGRQFTDESILQAWVFGDGSGNLFRFAVDDAGGEGTSEVSPWYPLDFTGWKLLKWDLRTGRPATGAMFRTGPWTAR
ncbi:MAG: Ig-like domain-containing protein [Candidatus Marinimicrobia bacterium]|nr:Ig-like domain-containing protein [Candidatus Neomarinimicrobiota bacterium]